MDISKLSPVEKKKLQEIMVDPVLWAKIFVKTFDPIQKKIVPWTARWYQVEMLRDKSLKKVARCGRRTGKCLPGWVEIFDPETGENIKIKDIYDKGEANVATMDADHKVVPTKTKIVMDNGVKEVFKVKLSSGKEIDATGNHPLYTVGGWKEIDDLSAGDYVATPKALPFFGDEDVSDEKVIFSAYMTGDGNTTSKRYSRFSTQSKKIEEEMNRILEKEFQCKLTQYESNFSHDFFITKIHDTKNNRIPNLAKDYLGEIDMLGKSALEKEVPSFVFKLSKEKTSLFLSRLFATDGWASARTSPRSHVEIGYGSSSKELIRGVQHLLLKFGIRSNFKERYVKYLDSKRLSYQLTFSNKESVKIFNEEIGLFSKEEAMEKVMSILGEIKEKEDIVPREIMDEIEEERKKLGLKRKDLALSQDDRLRMNYAPQRSAVRHYGRVLNNQRIQDLGSSDIAWEKIVSIESIGFHQTYDLTIPVTHNFVANDIIVHNTETMCIDSMHRTYTKPKHRVLFVTPYENQVRLIFMRIKELISTSEALKNEVARMTSNPYQIIWKNGSAIMGFTTGASSGSGGASIRGQRADYVYMDEVDYMGELDFDTVTTIAAERDDIGIFMSSTPTGKRSKFYEACTNKAMGYTEHYHPSTHNPNWNKGMEEEFRAQLSEQGYVHEIMAEFGTQDTGVFDKTKLDLACDQEYYHYDPLSGIQLDKVERLGIKPNSYVFAGRRAPVNPFRTMGVKLLLCRVICSNITRLIAGNSLEPSKLQHKHEIQLSVRAENCLDWTISSQALMRGRFND